MFKNISTVITLRDTLVLKIPEVLSFNKIVIYTDLPYNFDQVNKYWWRWYADIFGFFYNRVKRCYSLWFTMFLKHNIGVYMPFFFRMPSKKSKILDRWLKKSYLYFNTLQKKIYNFNIFQPLIFEYPSKFKLSDISNYSLFLINKNKRSLNSYGNFGNELDMFYSSYNYKWNNLYSINSLFYKAYRMPKNFFIIINTVFISSGFFINSFDSFLSLYPQFFLEYYNKLYTKSFFNLFSFFNINYNLYLYIIIIVYLFKLYINFINYKFYNYSLLFVVNNNNLINYKLNYYYYLIKIFINLNINILFLKFNKWYLLLLFLQKYKFLKIFYFKNYNSFTNQNLIYLNFFNVFKNFYNKWIINKRINKNYKWKYDIFFKFLNKIHIYKQIKINFLNKYVYFKKFYLFELYSSWKIFKNKFIFKNFKGNLSKKFFNKFYSKLLNYKFNKIKSCLNLLNYIYDLKSKYCNKFSFKNYKSFFFIKPSLKVTKIPFEGIIKWFTNYGKIFLRISDAFKIKCNYDRITFFTFSVKSLKLRIYTKYKKKLINNLYYFISKIYNIIIFNFKINFGLSFNLINFIKRKKDLNNFDNYFFINIQNFLINFIYFFKTILGRLIYSINSNKILFIKKFNLFDKIFFSYLLFFIKGSLNKNKIILINNFKYKYKAYLIKRTSYIFK